MHAFAHMNQLTHTHTEREKLFKKEVLNNFTVKVCSEINGHNKERDEVGRKDVKK